MCWVSLVFRAFPVHFPASYYELRPGERDGRLYERLGVLVAKRLLRRGPLHLLNRKVHFPPVIDAPGTVAISGEYKGRVRMTLTVHAVNAARRRLVLVETLNSALSLAGHPRFSAGNGALGSRSRRFQSRADGQARLRRSVARFA